ncbi:hypothetical protein FB451DRAFT_1243496 [Mycena latifolia]|nr:hypothetical protein FB451DRAFT_1243496 [Mycena latifolia]
MIPGVYNFKRPACGSISTCSSSLLTYPCTLNTQVCDLCLLAMAYSTLVETIWVGVSHSVLMTAIGLLMHGMYLVLVVLALYLLRQRRPTGTLILSCLIAVICVFATAVQVLQVVTTSFWLRSLHFAAQEFTSASEVQGSRHTEILVALVQECLAVTNNAIVDSLLTYRCYQIWKGSHTQVVLLPVVLGIATAASGYVSNYRGYIGSSDARLFYGLVVATNLSLTCLTVGRILYTRQALRAIGETKFIHRYNTAIEMLFVSFWLVIPPSNIYPSLESAALYLLWSCAAILARTLGGSTSIFIQTLYALGATLMNIVPVLLIVRVSLGGKPKGSPKTKNMSA